MKSNLFISYSSKEYEKVCSIKKNLESTNIICWMAPDNIPEGSNYSKEIPMIIYDTPIFLIFISKNSQNSPWVLRELEVASKENKWIVAYKLEDIDISDDFKEYIGEGEIIDGFNEISDTMDKLIKTLKECIEKGEKNTNVKKVNQRDGKGKMSLPDGSIYEGEWKNREINGKGIMKYKDGTVYDGNWLDEKFEGFGTITSPRGLIIDAEWIEGQKVGEAKITDYNGHTIFVECSYDRKTGIGMEVITTDNYYKGSFDRGMRSGNGKYFEKTGRYYEGEWKYGVKEGKGKENYENGTYYDGDWYNNKRHGYGKETYIDGSRYEGEWKDDVRCGYGIQYNYMGLIEYKGYWKNDRKIGKIKSFFIKLKNIFWS